MNNLKDVYLHIIVLVFFILLSKIFDAYHPNCHRASIFFLCPYIET